MKPCSLWWISIIPAFGITGCNTAGSVTGEVVARNGETVVTMAELSAELTGTLGSARNVPGPTKASVARALLRRRALAAAARRRGLDQQPVVQRQLEQVLVTALERDIRSAASAATHVTAADIAEHYQKHLERFRRPRMVSASCALAATEDEARGVAKKIGDALQRGSFPQVPLSRVVGAGVVTRRYGYVGRSSTAVPRRVLEAALAADRAFAVRGPIQLDDKWCVVVVDAIRPETTVALDVVKERIRHQLEQQARREAEKALLSAAYDESATHLGSF